MLSISDVSDADYYLRVGGSGCGGDGPSGGEAEDMLAYLAKGESPGEWLFVYRNDLGVQGKIRPDDESGERFRTVLNKLCHPINLQPLGRAPQKFRSVEEKVAAWVAKHPEATEEDIAAYEIEAEKHKAHAVHAWDMTFSPAKSISVAHAALEHSAMVARAEAEQLAADGDPVGAAEATEAAEGYDRQAATVKAAMRAGIDAAMTMAADEFGVTRRGAAGPDIDGRTTMRHVPEPNLQGAIFTHHVSRDRDPQLHAHVMVLNRILCGDGQWRALFASGLLKSKHQLDAVFTRVMEAYLTEHLGWRFVMRPDGVAREVAGVSQEVRDLFSARSRALSEEADEKLRQHMAEKGLKPEDVSALVRWRFQQQATITTRKAKLSPQATPTREEEVADWDAAIAKEFHEGFAAVIEEVGKAARTEPGPADFDPVAVIAQALADVTDRKGTFNKSHLMWAIDRHLPDMPGLSGTQIVELLRELTAAAVEGREVVSLAAPSPIKLPASLINPQSGESVFEPPRGGRFTTRTHLDREDWLIKLLSRRGTGAMPRAQAKAVVAGRGLSTEQADVAVEILCSRNFLEIVNAAAGTGKSRLMAALSDASQDVWGHGLTGFTASQNAAEVLAREGVSQAYNIEAFLTHHDNLSVGRASLVDQAKYAVPVGGTIVVDEASMVSTPQAVRLLTKLMELGVGRVVLIGDTEQVDAVDAGGGFRLLTGHRDPHALTQVRRFTHDWERDASAQLRNGDLSGLHEYDKRRRIRGGGEPEEVEAQAVQTVLEDMRAGWDTVLVVGTGDQAARLSSQIRAGLIRAGRVESDGLKLHDQTFAGRGDMIQTRLNKRDLDVVNREVWQVQSIDRNTGSLTVRRSERDAKGRQVWGETRVLPADYVADHVELAYAATVQAVQGRTVDVGHLLIDDQMGRSRAYPGHTRGRERNIMWVPIQRPARRHRETDEEYEARIPSALSAAVAAFEREDHTEAARSIIAAEQARAENMGHLGPQWQQLIAEHRESDHRQLLREVVGEGTRLFSDLSVDGLLHLLRSAEHHGYDVRAVVTEAHRQTAGRLDSARSPASMLYTLVNRQLERPDVVPVRARDEADSYAERTPRGEGEIEVARQTGELMDQREAVLGERTEVEAPAWATALLGGVPADIVAREDRREKLGIVAGYREMTGWRNPIDPIGPTPSRSQPELRWAHLRAARALGQDTTRDVTAASDAELANKVLAWRREQESMTRNVDADLREANEAAAYARSQVTRAKDRGEDPAPWSRMVAEQEARAKRLDLVDKGRKADVERTAEVRGAAQEAVRELAVRAERDRKVAERAAAEHAETERVRREADDNDSRIHEAVGERWREQWVPDAPRFGSQRWAELDDDAPEKRSAIVTAAMSWWRMGNQHDERAITERLVEHGADRLPDYETLGRRGVERVRAGEDEREVHRSEPSDDPAVLREIGKLVARDFEGDAPEYGSRGYADADARGREKAETRSAVRWWNVGDDLDERAARADRLDDKASARAISELTQERRHAGQRRNYIEMDKGRDQEPAERPQVTDPEKEEAAKPLPARPDLSWVRAAQQAERQQAEREKEPEREPEPARDKQRTPEPAAKPDRTPEPERKDDLDEQLARSRAALDRAAQSKREAEQQREATEQRDTAPTRQPEPTPTREPEAPQR